LLRIFAGDRLKAIMDRLKLPDGEAIEAGMVSRAIESAQRKVEARNFDIRKNLLEYDDVMNEQRKTVYRIRQQLLLGIYTPEVLGDDGKPTGKLRSIAPLDRLIEEMKPAIVQLMLHHGIASSPDNDVQRPTSIETIDHIADVERLRNDIYHFWGYRFDFKEGDGSKPKAVYERLLQEIPASFTQ